MWNHVQCIYAFNINYRDNHYKFWKLVILSEILNIKFNLITPVLGHIDHKLRIASSIIMINFIRIFMNLFTLNKQSKRIIYVVYCIIIEHLTHILIISYEFVINSLNYTLTIYIIYKEIPFYINLIYKFFQSHNSYYTYKFMRILQRILI